MWCGNNSWGGCGCLWIIILIIILFCCCGGGNWGGCNNNNWGRNDCDNNCGCC